MPRCSPKCPSLVALKSKEPFSSGKALPVAGARYQQSPKPPNNLVKQLLWGHVELLPQAGKPQTSILHDASRSSKCTTPHFCIY